MPTTDRPTPPLDARVAAQLSQLAAYYVPFRRPAPAPPSTWTSTASASASVVQAAEPVGDPPPSPSSTTTRTTRTTTARTTAPPPAPAPRPWGWPPGGLDLGRVRAAQAPPECPPGGDRFVTASGRWVWAQVALGVPDRHRWDSFLKTLISASSLTSIRLQAKPPPGHPECSGICSVHSGNGQTWAELYVDPRDTDEEQRRHVRHEVGHAVDVVASGRDWPELGKAHRLPASEAWARHCETWLTSTRTAAEALAECRRFHRGRRA